ncbi:ribokinase [Parasphingorhabdus sp.]|uniref:ribokinase n=1 Tax=Parasphingorhabdus sp. TaxID=2709688 RepID=UPI0032ED8C1A
MVIESVETCLDRYQMTRKAKVVVLGAFVADLSFQASRLPQPGETIIGSSFSSGPGGKGSNQAIAAARAGADVHFISRLGNDAFGNMALKVWEDDKIETRVEISADAETGAAFIHVNTATGENAIIVTPGAASGLTEEYVAKQADLIRSADVFVTQLEQPIGVAMLGLELARSNGVTTILNPAPAELLPAKIYSLCDLIVPNESEASGLTGIEVVTLDDARLAADVLLARGVGAVIITLGHRGALLHLAEYSVHIPPVRTGAAVDTAGAGDAFIGGLAAAIGGGLKSEAAANFASVVAGLSVTKPGTAPAMPRLSAIQNYLAVALKNSGE